MGLRELLGVLRRFWLFAATVLSLVVVLGIIAAYAPKPRYRATATLIVSPASGRIDFTSVDTVQFLLPSLSAQVDTETFTARVQQRLPSNTPLDRTKISPDFEAGTSIFRIRAQGEDRYATAAVANAAAQEVVQHPLSNLVKLAILDPARTPRSPFSPKRALILFAASVLGLIAAVLSAVGANAVFPRVRVQSSSDIRGRFGLEVIGEIPRTRGFPREASWLFDPASGYSGLVEAYQRLRANFDIVADGCGAVAVASCISGEGKSSVAANLAWAAASMGENVIAVDADLRRPTLHEYFGILPGSGLADIPRGAEIEDLIKPTALPTLRVVPAGFPEEHPTAVLNNAYPQVLDAFSDSRVIVDMPPILGTADAVLIAAMTKAVILVSDIRHGDPDRIGQAIHEFHRAGAKVLGVVLNHVSRRPRIDYYYYSPPPDTGHARTLLRNPDA